MKKSELIDKIAQKMTGLTFKNVDLASKEMLKMMSSALADARRIEIRGFGSFSLHHHAPRWSRNPKTGAPVFLEERHLPHFKPGTELRDRVNKTYLETEN